MLLGIGGGLLLGALGLLPVILRHGAGGGPWVAFADHFVSPHQLRLAGWGTGPSIPGPADTLTFQLGLVACGLAAIGSVCFKFGARKHPERVYDAKFVTARDQSKDAALPGGRSAPSTPPPSTPLRSAQDAPLTSAPNVQAVMAVTVLLLAFLSTTLSAPLWKLLPFLARPLTYPWQLLLLAGPWLAWLAAAGGRALLDLLPEEEQGVAPALASGLPLIAGLAALALLGVYGDLSPLTTGVSVGDAPVALFGEDRIALLSATPSGAPGPGGQVEVEVLWQALRPLDQDYTVFLHVLGGDGTVWGQVDTMPQAGKLPTTGWRPGQVVSDRYQVTLKPDAPSGAGYTYWLGLYQWQTGQRLAAGSDDKVVLSP